MNSLVFDALKLRILVHLHRKGPATSEKLAAELAAPHGNVVFALETLETSEEKLVRRLPFGMWDVDEGEQAA